MENEKLLKGLGVICENNSKEEGEGIIEKCKLHLKKRLQETGIMYISTSCIDLSRIQQVVLSGRHEFVPNIV